MERDFRPLTKENLWDRWGKWHPHSDPGILTGHRGESAHGAKDNGFGSSEGVGLYISRTEQDAGFFGKTRPIHFPTPKNPLIVDEDLAGDTIPLLHEEDEIWPHILGHKPAPTDSVWIKAHVLAAKRIGLTEETWEEKIDQLPRAVTDILLQMGHDAIYARSAGMQWAVLLVPEGQRLNRGIRSEGGTALYSPAPSTTVPFDAEAIRRATESARQAVAATPVADLRRIGQAWLTIGERQDTHQLGKHLTARTIPKLLKQLPEDLVGITAVNNGRDGYGNQLWDINTSTGTAYLTESRGYVWLDTSAINGKNTYLDPRRRRAAAGAPIVYQIAQAYARNTGGTFIPDPGGVSSIAVPRRWSQMLSSAARFQNTSHIDPNFFPTDHTPVSTDLESRQNRPTRSRYPATNRHPGMVRRQGHSRRRGTLGHG